jgi:hypothetical protein
MVDSLDFFGRDAGGESGACAGVAAADDDRWYPSLCGRRFVL